LDKHNRRAISFICNLLGQCSTARLARWHQLQGKTMSHSLNWPGCVSCACACICFRYHDGGRIDTAAGGPGCNAFGYDSNLAAAEKQLQVGFRSSRVQCAILKLELPFNVRMPHQQTTVCTNVVHNGTGASVC
jgi:hypothetical protein